MPLEFEPFFFWSYLIHIWPLDGRHIPQLKGYLALKVLDLAPLGID
jgi:hypothetical protein